MRLWDKRVEWKTIVNIEVYSMVLTKNIALDKIRRTKLQMEIINDDRIDFSSGDMHDYPDEIEKQEQTRMVWDIIKRLPDKQQILIKLREVEELSYEEIANEMNLTEAQVKVMLFRVRRKIKEIYFKINGNKSY